MTLPTPDAFGELRSLVQRPGQPQWLTMCELFQRWPADVLRDKIIPYVQDHFEGVAWSQIERPVPTAWPRAVQNKHLHKEVVTLANMLECSKQLLMALPDAEEQLWLDTDWSMIRTLDLDETALMRSAYQLLGRLDWSGVHTLRAKHANLNATLCAEIIHWPLPNLRHFDCRLNALDAESLKLLTNAPWWSQLETLWIGQRDLSAQSMQTLSTSSAHALRHLHIQTWPIDWPTATTLSEARWLENLNTLEIFNGTLDIDCMAMLFGTLQWPSLKNLHLPNNTLGEHGMRYLSRTRIARQLELLNLSMNRLDAQAITACESLCDAHQMRHLNISRNPVGDQLTEELPHMQPWSALTTLNLSSTRLSRESLSSICGHWPQLEHLILDGNLMGPTTLQHLLMPTAWPNLKTLSLRSASIDPQDLAGALEAPKPPALHALDLRYNDLKWHIDLDNLILGDGWSAQHVILG